MADPDLPRPAAHAWADYLNQWDRSLRAANKAITTRSNYELAVAQLAGYLAAECTDDDAPDAAADPAAVTKSHIEAYLGWMIETRSASTARNKHKGLQQFFRYLTDEEEIDRSPMERVSQPKVVDKLIPIVTPEEHAALLATCAGKTFRDRRDSAIIHLLADTGGRLAEVGNLNLDDVSFTYDVVKVDGKTGPRAIPFAPDTGQALTRYLRLRKKHKGAELPNLWLAERGDGNGGGVPLDPNGIKIMLKRRGLAAGIPNMHAHRYRHTVADWWRREGGGDTELMMIMGWNSPEMLHRYGRSAATARAHDTKRRLDAARSQGPRHTRGA